MASVSASIARSISAASVFSSSAILHLRLPLGDKKSGKKIRMGGLEKTKKISGYHLLKFLNFFKVKVRFLLI